MPEKNISDSSISVEKSKVETTPTKKDLDSGKISKIVGTARSVTEELANIVDLKVKLVQTDIEEKVNQRVNALIQKSIVSGLIGIVVFFALTGLALIVGDYLGSSGLGFLSISGIILLLGLVLKLVKPKLFTWQMDRIDIAGLIGSGETLEKLSDVGEPDRVLSDNVRSKATK